MRTNRLRRAELSTPASSEKMVQSAAASNADLVFLDLEDAVAPAEKESARELAINALNELDWGKTTRAVRVNSADTEWAHDDVIEVVARAGQNLDVIIIPKVFGPRDVWFFETLVEQLEQKLGLSQPIGFEVLIEEAAALSRVEEIAASSPRLESLILGFGDLSASLGFRGALLVGDRNEDAYPADPWHFARCRMIAAAKANGIDAIDGPFANYHDPEGYRREATWASTLGAAGKWAIHPAQIALAHEVFSPTEDEVTAAREMVAAYESAVAIGDGAGSANSGTLVDAATVRLFAPVVERAKRIEEQESA